MALPVPNFVKPLLRGSRTAQRIARRLRPQQSADPASNEFAEMKRQKLARIEPILKSRMPYVRKPLCYDFLSDALQREFHIDETDNVSSLAYDSNVTGLIEQHQDGLVLDCGAGLRPEYLPNVVNFEICSYPTTDVRGVGERLPFRDGVFDAVLSLQVLEHVRDPFACSREIVRVLKPGGALYCVVPFLQPMHGYPSHYFNMSMQGLGRLFEDSLVIDRQEVGMGGRPIFSLTWILQRWLAELPPDAATAFAAKRVADLIASPEALLAERWVSDLPDVVNAELASATTLYAHKPLTLPAPTGVRHRIGQLTRLTRSISPGSSR